MKSQNGGSYRYDWIQSKLQFQVNKYHRNRVYARKYTVCKTIQEIYRIVLHRIFGGMNPIALIFVDLELKFGLESNHNGRNLHFDLLENARNFPFDLGVLEPFFIIV